MDVINWIQYFESNRGSYTEPDWSAPRSLQGGRELDLLRTSLATFQLGETGEGRTLQRYAKRLAGERHFDGYGEALRLFVDEEKMHAQLLAQALGYLGGDLIQRQWTNSIFRRARRLINLEFEIQIFVTAEIIGKAYYSLLYRHVDDPVVKSVCGKLVSDEVKHLNFHIEFFRARMEHLPRFRRWLWQLQFEAIFSAARQAVWLDHGRCLRAFGVSRSEFMLSTTRGLRSLLTRLHSTRALVPTIVPATGRPPLHQVPAFITGR
ncbi:MAG: hypothetical protein ACR2RV_29905 [Verrucomicrobiales bacterium]